METLKELLLEDTFICSQADNRKLVKLLAGGVR